MRHAIYIDFETLQEPPTPAILGILNDDEQGLRFEQAIVDQRLHPGVVARPDLRVDRLADVIVRLLERDLPLVAWSNFDRDVVLRSDLSSALKTGFADRYVNALTEARTWRTKVHPSIKIVRASAKDPRHTLDQYAAATGYPSAGALKGAKPAAWIRHLLQQIAARKHYRRVTKEAKRDWHKLLDYNRHDCFALRHVHQKASSELQKWREYEKTTYCVNDESGGEVCFQVGSHARRLGRLLDRYGARKWAFLTAWNPASTQLSRADNDQRQNDMLAQLTAAGFRCLAGVGRGQDTTWPPEESVLALDIPERVAREIGRRFGQLAIVVGERGRPSRLVACL